MQADGAQQVVQNTLDALGPIDILINNVGGSQWTPFGDVSDEEWCEIFDMNLWAAVRTTRAALPSMQEHGSGVVITISSIFGRESGGPVTYNAAKAAEISMAKTLAKELAPSSGDITRTLTRDSADHVVGSTETFWLVDLAETESYQSEFELVFVSPHAYWYVEDGLTVSQSGIERSASRACCALMAPSPSGS